MTLDSPVRLGIQVQPQHARYPAIRDAVLRLEDLDLGGEMEGQDLRDGARGQEVPELAPGAHRKDLDAAMHHVTGVSKRASVLKSESGSYCRSSATSLS